MAGRVRRVDTIIEQKNTLSLGRFVYLNGVVLFLSGARFTFVNKKTKLFFFSLYVLSMNRSTNPALPVRN